LLYYLVLFFSHLNANTSFLLPVRHPRWITTILTTVNTVQFYTITEPFLATYSFM